MNKVNFSIYRHIIYYKITFENFREFIPRATGINLSEFNDIYVNKFTYIRFLNISEYKINILPKELFDKQLRIFNCYWNNIKVIPSEIGNCKELQIFDCSVNQITFIQSKICKR